MEWIEITAKTVDDAKERALDELGIDHDEAEFVVLEEPRRGLFRQQRGTARVRARVKPRTPRAKTERRPRRGGGKPRGEDTSRRGAGGSNGDKPASKRGESPQAKSESAPRQRGGRDDSSDKKSKRSGSGSSRQKTQKEQGTKMSMTLDDQIAASETFLTGLLEAFGVEGRISTERTDESNAHVNIEGGDLGLLIGPRGQTMNAIQDLTRIMLQKQAAGSWEGHVHVDVNGYRAKRREALVAFVQKVAADVLESGTPKALEPMTSSDRKVVHDTVNEIDGVTTSSEGRDPRRWVQISPDDA